MKTMLGWSRGNANYNDMFSTRRFVEICNAITTFCGGGYGTTTPLVIEIYKTDNSDETNKDNEGPDNSGYGVPMPVQD